jgi:hypothetical protein
LPTLSEARRDSRIGSYVNFDTPVWSTWPPALGNLTVGERLDGHAIISVERIPYRHGFTHDILPESDTGAYRAGGVWLGSTLRHQAGSAPSAR